jgi:hypothetical protein
MGVFDELAKILSPHAHRLNENIATQGNLIHGRLGGIQNALDDLGRPDFGDKWFRIPVRGKLKAEPLELNTVPMNEIWAVQAIAVNGKALKTPAFTILASGALVFALETEKNEYDNVSGNIIFMPGETITIVPAAEGEFSATISIIRRQVPDVAKRAQTGHSGERLAPSNTHDPARDVIESRTGEYAEPAPEVRNTSGRPPLVDPTSV